MIIVFFSFYFIIEPSSSPSQISVMHFPSSPPHSEPPEQPEMRRTPPPLPPRRGNSTVMSEAIAAVPPTPPPRVDSDRPPPVPPRRDSMPSSALARSHSMSHPRSAAILPSSSGGVPAQAFFPGGSSTLPRHGFERHSSERNFVSGPPPVVDFNSNEDYGDRPVLPPRTYLAHLSHLRNQTS